MIILWIFSFVSLARIRSLTRKLLIIVLLVSIIIVLRFFKIASHQTKDTTIITKSNNSAKNDSHSIQDEMHEKEMQRNFSENKNKNDGAFVNMPISPKFRYYVNSNVSCAQFDLMGRKEILPRKFENKYEQRAFLVNPKIDCESDPKPRAIAFISNHWAMYWRRKIVCSFSIPGLRFSHFQLISLIGAL